MKKILILVFAILLNVMAFCCGNEYGYTLDGKRVHTRYFFLSERMLHFDKVQINKNLKALNFKVKEGTDDFKTWSNIALNLMKLGQVDSSIQILKPLLGKYPNEYNLIANLGTAYELNGQLDSALYYINKGFKLNPTSHLKSEWVHISILEAKIQERRHTGWLKTHSVIDLNELIERVGHYDRARRTDKISQEIFLQVRTRVPFTPAPNKIIANILETLGDFNSQVGTYENALLAYAYAMDFGEDGSEHIGLIQKIKVLNNKRIDSGKVHELSVTFQRMLKRSQVLPDLLVLGLPDFAESQDEFHQDMLAKNDSLHLLSIQLDSLKLITANKIELIKKSNHNEILNIQKVEKQMSYIYLIVGLIIGGLIMFFLGRRKE